MAMHCANGKGAEKKAPNVQTCRIQWEPIKVMTISSSQLGVTRLVADLSSHIQLTRSHGLIVNYSENDRSFYALSSL